MNLIDIAKGYLTDAITDKVAGLIGGDRASTGNAFGAAIPSILGGLIGKTSTQDGAEDLHRSLQNHNGGFLDNLGGALDGDGFNSIASSGSGILSGLLGNNLGGVVDMISRVSGIGSKGSGSLMGLVTSLVMGIIGKKVGGGLGISGLMNLLSGQKRHVASALPAGMGGALGLGDISGWGSAPEYVEGAVSAPVAAAASTAAPASTTTTSSGTTASTGSTQGGGGGGGLPKWLIPLALLGLLGLLAFMFLPKLLGAAPSVEVPEVPELTMPEGFKALDLGSLDPTQSVNTLSGYFTDTTAALDGVTDVSSAEAAAPGLNGLALNIGSLAGFKDKVPANLQDKFVEAGVGLEGPLNIAKERFSGLPGVSDVMEGPLSSLFEAVGKFK